MTDETTTSTTSRRAPRTFSARALVLVALLSGAGTLALALAISRGLAPRAAPEGALVATAAPVREVEVKEQWQCPMHPSVVQDHAANCPICGMKLVKMDGGGASAQPSEAESRAGVDGLATVDIDPARQQLIGLTTVSVKRGTVGGAWRTVGRVAVDETRVRHVNVKVSGFVEKVYVDFIGRPVRRGERLFSIYSPELYAAQEEYLLALRTRKRLADGGGSLAHNGDELVASARRKLELWDIPASELRRLEQGGKAQRALALYSPISGVVVKKDVVDGMKLDAGAMPYEIVDLGHLWVLADVYESELRHVQVGMPATLELQAFPNRRFEGKVVFIDPLLDPKTRTVKVRLTFPNPTGELRPEMYGEVTLRGQSRDALRIPTDAVIDSGTRHVVFASLGDGKFQPREVKLGDGDGSFVEVLEGLREGEQVVTRANFLIDSESRLKASLAAMAHSSAPAAPPPAPPAADPHTGHGGH